MSAASFIALMAAAAAAAAPGTGPDGPDAVVVTASRIPVPESASGTSITVIDRNDIEARQSVFVTDLLRDVPGVAVSQSGGPGSQAQVRIRGAEANQVLVLVDGIEANDPAGNDEFGFQDLTTWDVERVEVVRGPQSALWGSDALAGVINVITRPAAAGPVAQGFSEGGSFGTLAGGGRIGGEILGTSASLSISGLHSDGVNNSRTGSEDDGYRNTTATLRLAGTPADGLTLGLLGRYTEATKSYDGVDYATGLPGDSGDRSRVGLGYFQVGGRLETADGRAIQSLRASLTSTNADNTGDFGDTGSTGADKYGAYYQGTWRFTPGTADSPGNSVTVALDGERQEFRQRGPVIVLDPTDPALDLDPNQDQHMDSTAAAVELILAPWAGTSVSLSGRHDASSDYASVNTYRGTLAWTSPEWASRLHASYGTGQKAPTFSERYGYYPGQFVGNSSLDPEKSRGWEAGVDQPFEDGRITLGATYFHEDLTDEIDGFVYVPELALYTADNLAGTSHRRGVEATGRVRLSDRLRVGATYTYVDADQPDPVTGDPAREIRRPRHLGSINTDWRSADGRIEVNLNLAYTGGQTDTFFEPVPPYGADTVHLGAYTLASIAAGYQATQRTRVYVRIENLFDQDYENVYGYNTPGLAAYAGLRVGL